MHQGSQTLESIAHDEGRFLAVQGASGTEFIDTWHVRDYLGSVRAVYDITPEPEDVASAGNQILEQNDYYAFGGRIDTPYQAYDQTNRYRYNGKEQLRFEGINLDPGLTDYGARYYAPTFGRWTTPDPLADKYYSVSPYVFCNNNPVNFIDPDGRFVWAIPAMKLVAYATGAAVTLYAAQKLTKYEASKYNPGWDYQRQNDRKGKEALDKAQLNVQNSFKENFPDPDNFDPNDGPKFRNGTNGALILGMLALIGNCSNPDDMKDDNDNSEQSTEVIIKPSDGQDSVNNEDKSKFEQIWDFFVKYLTY